MADDKRGREKQSTDADNRQRERDMATQRERADDPEPPVEAEIPADLADDLESLPFPATGADVVAAVGDRQVKSADQSYTVAELVPDTEAETFEAPGAVQELVQRPTVAAAMKRIIEVSRTVPGKSLSDSQRDAYRRTFEELQAIDAVDEDEGIQVISDWIVDEMRTAERRPNSRDVRRQAAKYCRSSGYEVSNDDWLGI